MLTRPLPILFSLLAFAVAASAQPKPIPFHIEPYVLDSGLHQGNAAGTVTAFRQVARVAQAPWLRLHFDAYELGANSYVTITSLKDGDQQRLDARTLAEWLKSTAYFNGDAVEVALHVAPDGRDVFIRMREITVGEVPAAGPVPETICGTTDDRTPSADPRVGRIVPVGCTGWIIANGAHLTAGHCTGATMQTLQFNVPPSMANGAIQNPPAADQYPINAASVVFVNNGVGDDWAVFRTNRSAAFGANRLPVEAQNAFYRVSRDENPATIRIAGYGVDGPGPGAGCPAGMTCDFGNTGPRDASNQTQQTHVGASLGETITGPNNARWNYSVDTQPANSGSPLQEEGTTTTIGIHTSGGCTATAGTNSGTSFEHQGLQNAINGFPGANFRYVDDFGNSNIADGTLFRPFRTMPEAVPGVPANGTLSIVPGLYLDPVTITTPMTLVAPVGAVKLGP